MQRAIKHQLIDITPAVLAVVDKEILQLDQALQMHTHLFVGACSRWRDVVGSPLNCASVSKMIRGRMLSCRGVSLLQVSGSASTQSPLSGTSFTSSQPEPISSEQAAGTAHSQPIPLVLKRQKTEAMTYTSLVHPWAEGPWLSST